MRTLKLAEKQENLRSLIQSMKPLKLNFGTLPLITEKEQNQNHLKIKSWQESPKVFINSDEALVWIKKDIEKKNRHDLFQMIKRKAERELTLEKINSIKTKERRSRRNLSHTLRKYSSTSRCIIDKVSKVDVSSFNTTQKVQQKKQAPSHFLRIKVAQTLPAPSSKQQKPKPRMRTQKPKHEPQPKHSQQQKRTTRVGSQSKFTKKNIHCQDSFNVQFLSPW